MKLLFLLFILFMIVYSPRIMEGMIPNETQFVIHKSVSNKGDDYVPLMNPVASENKGFFSSLFKVTKESMEQQGYATKDDIYYNKAPLSSNQFLFNPSDYFNTNKVIDYKENKWKPPINPFDTHSKVNDNYGILYNNTKKEPIHKLFTKEHKINEEEILSRSSISTP